MTPYCSDDITLDWLNQVFTQDEITDFSSEIIGGGVGVLGELARLTLTYDKKSDRPETVVAKFSSPLQETRDAAGSFGFYEMENKFYAELSEHLPIKVPRCYYQAYAASYGFVSAREEPATGEIHRNDEQHAQDENIFAPGVEEQTQQEKGGIGNPLGHPCTPHRGVPDDPVQQERHGEKEQ